MDIVWKKSSFMPSCQICLLSPVISDDRSGFFQRGTEKSPKFSIQRQITRFRPVFDGPGDPDKGKKPERQEFLWSSMPRNHQKSRKRKRIFWTPKKGVTNQLGLRGWPFRSVIQKRSPNDPGRNRQKEFNLQASHRISGKWFFKNDPSTQKPFFRKKNNFKPKNTSQKTNRFLYFIQQVIQA